MNRKQSSTHYILFLSLLSLVGCLYLIANSQERHERSKADMARQMAQMDAVSATATKKAKKEYEQ